MIRFAAIATAVLLAMPTVGHAESTHLCTGLGQDARDEAKTFSHTLKLVYAAANGNYLGDIAITVARDGSTVHEGTCDGPWMLLNLEPGTYTVTSVFEGQSRTTKVEVGSRPVETTIVFKATD